MTTRSFSQRLISSGQIVIAVLFFSVCAHAEMNIEQLQREFQARFNFDTEGNYVLWPPNKCGSPAPLYPPDGFYGSLDNDPEFAAYLVSDLCAQFYGGYEPLYITGNLQFDYNSNNGLWAPVFLKNSNIAGQASPPPYYSSADFPTSGAGFNLTAVTAANYAQCFFTLRKYVEGLF
jgi:hypothetical protein